MHVFGKGNIMLKKNCSYYSPRIFEINKVWIDKRTLTLSMRSGGWSHPQVMDAFGILIIADLYYRDKEGISSKNEVLKHVVLKDVTVENQLPFFPFPYSLHLPFFIHAANIFFLAY